MLTERSTTLHTISLSQSKRFEKSCLKKRKKHNPFHSTSFIQLTSISDLKEINCETWDEITEPLHHDLRTDETDELLREDRDLKTDDSDQHEHSHNE